MLYKRITETLFPHSHPPKATENKNFENFMWRVYSPFQNSLQEPDQNSNNTESIMPFKIQIGSIIDLNFNNKEDATLFAEGYNTGIKSKDFEYGDFDTEMERRGFDFSHKVWIMLNQHSEEEKFQKSKAVVTGSSPCRFKPRISYKTLS